MFCLSVLLSLFFCLRICFQGWIFNIVFNVYSVLVHSPAFIVKRPNVPSASQRHVMDFGSLSHFLEIWVVHLGIIVPLQLQEKNAEMYKLYFGVQAVYLWLWYTLIRIYLFSYLFAKIPIATHVYWLRQITYELTCERLCLLDWQVRSVHDNRL